MLLNVASKEFTGTANAKPLDPKKQGLRRGIFKRRTSGADLHPLTGWQAVWALKWS